MRVLIYASGSLNKAGPLLRISTCQANNLSSRLYRQYHSTHKGLKPALVTTRATMEEATNYQEWSHESLVKRVTELERELKGKNVG